MKVLIVTTAFYPEQAIGSIRMSKMAKTFHACGDDLTVLSLTPCSWSRRDESLYFAGMDEVHWQQIGQSSLFSRTLSRGRRAVVGERSAVSVGTAKQHSFLSKLRRSVLGSAQFGYTFFKAIDWVRQVCRYAKLNLASERFDFIITSYPSLASPLAGLALKQMGLSDHVVIDFRDPISYGATHRFGLRSMFERFLVKRGALVSFISEGIKDKIICTPVLRSTVVSHVAPNGFDSDDVSSGKEMASLSPKIKFCYVGALYGGKRNLDPFFNALQVAVEEYGWPISMFELHYAGSEGQQFKQQAAKREIESLVIDHGMITRQESLELQMASDVCLLVTWNTNEDQGILTGKLFEFFQQRKNVLAVVNGNLPNSETKKVIDLVGAGFCYEEASPDGIAELSGMANWIDRCCLQKKETNKLADSYNDNVDLFDVSKVFRRLREEVASVIDVDVEK